MSRTSIPQRGLSVHQPWAWAIACGRKPVENRARAFPRALAGAPVALHASRTAESALLLPDPAALAACVTADADLDPLLALGAVIAVVTFTGSHKVCRMAAPPAECSPWSVPGCHHWTVAEVEPLAEPVPCRGMPGFWPLPPGVGAAITAQLAAARRNP